MMSVTQSDIVAGERGRGEREAWFSVLLHFEFQEEG